MYKNINISLIFTLIAVFLLTDAGYARNFSTLRVPVDTLGTKGRMGEALTFLNGARTIGINTSNDSVANLREQIRGLINRKELQRFTRPLAKLSDYENRMQQLNLQLGIGDVPAKRNRDSFIVEEVLIELTMHQLGQESRLAVSQITERDALRQIYLKALELARCVETVKFLKNMDSAPNAQKAQLVVSAISQLSQMVWKNEGPVISEKRVNQIEDRHNRFLRRYSRQRNLPLSLEGYMNIDTRSLIKIAEDMYVTTAGINRKTYYLILFKDAAYSLNEDGNPITSQLEECYKDIKDFRLIPVDSEAEIRRYRTAAGIFAQKTLHGKEREKAEEKIKGIFGGPEALAKNLEFLKKIEEFLGEKRSDHPDLPFAALTLGSPESRVLLGAAQPVQIPAKTEEKTRTFAELADEALLRPIESLIKRDESGQPRALTQEEMLLAYRKGALHALKTSSYKDNSDLRQWIMRILKAIRAGNMEFERTVEKNIITERVSFPELRQDVQRDILTAATIPMDEKTWVFLEHDANLYQAAYALTRVLGINQKMVIIQADREDYYRQDEDFLSAVIMEAYEQTKIIEGEVNDKERWIDFHNRFLQRLHYSYKVDARFRKEIDLLRAKVLSQINPGKREAFRFIAGNIVTAFALEFAARTGEEPLVANPYVRGFWANLSNEKTALIRDEPYYFMSYSELYRRHRDAFKMRYLFFNQIIDDWNAQPKLRGGMTYLWSVLRTIFTYNEIIAFLGNEEDRKVANPTLETYETKQFSLPGTDFTRPDEEEAFGNMFIGQLFQAVEGFSQEEWDRHRNDVLNRYSYLAAKREIDAGAFIEHISRLAEKDFDIVWDRDKKSWEKGDGYYIKRAERTRAIIEAVLRFSESNFLCDEFLAQYYSQADEIKDDNTFVYFKREYRWERKKTGEQISQSDAINNLCEPYASQGFMGRYPLYVLSMIMDISPQRIGPKMMNFLVAMADAAKDRYDIYIKDEYGWQESYYGIVLVFYIPYIAFDDHPEYYAKLLLESSLTPDLLTFLIRPETAPSRESIFSFVEFGEREMERESFLSDNMLQEMVRQNSLEGNQFKMLRTIISDSPNVASDVILREWREFDNHELNLLLGLKTRVDNSHFERMEVLFKERSLNNRAVALFLAMNPGLGIKAAKTLDQLFKDDSVQVIFGLLRVIRNRQWTEQEINALYRTNLWSLASPNVRHRNLQQILNLSKEDRNKFFIAFSGKKLKPQNIFDIYPLNIPEGHTLYGQYSHELKAYSMSFSSFVLGEIGFKSMESEEDTGRRIMHRSKLLFNDLDAVLKFPKEEILRRVALLEGFETNNAELDNTAYRLLMVIPKEHFNELYSVLEGNFASLKNLKQAKREMATQFRQIIELNPELKDLPQKAIVRWAAEQLGIILRRRFTEQIAQQNIKTAFRNKLAKNDLGKKVTIGKADEEENKKYMTLVAANKLLSAIVENLIFYKPWLEEIPDVETDPRKMLPAGTAIMQNL